MEEEREERITCPICGLVYPKSETEYCSSCGRDVCTDCYSDNHDCCDECAVNLQDTYMDEDDDDDAW